MIVKTPGSQTGSPAAAEGAGEAMGGGRVEREVKSKRGRVDTCGYRIDM